MNSRQLRRDRHQIDVRVRAANKIGRRLARHLSDLPKYVSLTSSAIREYFEQVKTVFQNRF